MSYFTKCCDKPTLGIPPDVVNKRLNKQLDFLRKDSNKMRECLEWYGDKSNWIAGTTLKMHTLDGHKRAQKCLDELSE